MKLPLQVVFRNIEPSDAVTAVIRERVDRLERFYEHIMSCRVVVELHHHHHHKGNLYHVRADLKVPDEEIVAGRKPSGGHTHEDVYVAIRDTFDALRRQLEDYIRRRRGVVKTHVAVAHGRVIEMHPDDGRIETSDGRVIYFHRNSVLDADFDHLDIGTEVRYTEEAGEMGPQASTVHVIGKHHLAS